MAQHSTTADRVLRLARRAGLLRARDLAPHGLHPENLRRLCARGLLVRAGRGLYVPANADATENRTLAEIGKRVPHGVVCLLSALQFHGLTTQLPFEVWLAVDRAVDRRSQAVPRANRCLCGSSAFRGTGLSHRRRGTPR